MNWIIPFAAYYCIAAGLILPVVATLYTLKRILQADKNNLKIVNKIFGDNKYVNYIFRVLMKRTTNKTSTII